MKDSHMDKSKVLFICTANSERSPTAEMMVKGSEKYEAKSAGVHPFANRVVDQALIDWADIIFVMSKKEGHLAFLEKSFDLTGKELHDLDIPDRFPRGSIELQRLLQKKLVPYLDLRFQE